MASPGVLAPFVLLYFSSSFLTANSQNRRPTLEYSLFEERPVGADVGNLLIDASLHTKYAPATLNRLTFSFLSSGEKHTQYFSIEKRSGVIRTKARLDRDTLCPELQNCVFDMDITVYPIEYFQILKVRITVKDINDHAPTFPKEAVHLTISEGKTPGPVTNLPIAQDADSGENGIQGYRLMSASRAFKISTSGKALLLLLNNLLDRETTPQHDLTVIAVDGGIPHKSGSLMIRVTVSDINDNVPVFSNETYKVAVFENVTIHTSVMRVRASDADDEMNSQISYVFSEDSITKYGNLFTIESQSGTIYVIGKLTYRGERPYKLTVIARDKGQDSVPVEAEVHIKVLDVNDHSPEITVHIPRNTGEVQIAENSPEGSFVVLITVDDKDGGRNGECICSLDDRTFELRRIYSTKYKLVASTVLDRERQDRYSLRIRCRDRGRPPLVSSRMVTVTVTDVNDNPPKFSQRSYFASIEENRKAGTFITQFKAVDADTTANAAITYSLAEDSRTFVVISPTTGIITSKIPFDHERTQTIEVIVHATDGGKDSNTATATLLLTVQDVNDERPTFSIPAYTYHVLEKQPVGTTVGRVYATDADSEPFNKFTFAIESDGQMSSAFTIDAQDGGIRLARLLSKNNASVYHIIVVATESEAPWSKSKTNVSIYLVDKMGNIEVEASVKSSHFTDNLRIILALCGALVLMLIILFFIVIAVYKKRQRRNRDRRGYISGNLVRVNRKDANHIRGKDEMIDSVWQDTIRKQLFVNPSNYPSMDKSDSWILKSEHSPCESSIMETKDSRELLTNAAVSTPRGTLRSLHSDRRRASQNSKASSGRQSDARRRAADGASQSSVGSKRDPANRSSNSGSEFKEIKEKSEMLSIRHQGPIKDSDSACSADVSNSESCNGGSDPEGDGSLGRPHRSSRSRFHPGPIKSRGVPRRTENRRFKADSLSSPDLESSAYQLDQSKDDAQAGPSGGNRIALVHPQRNGSKDSGRQLGEQISLSDSCQGARESDEDEQEENPETVVTRDYEFEADSDTGSSGARRILSGRIRPDGQSQGRPPKTGPSLDRHALSQGSCLNDTDFYESDSESRGRNILV